MSTIEAEAVSPLFQRVQRERKPRPKATPEDRMVDDALRIWSDWLQVYLAPRDSRARLDIGTAYEAAIESTFKRMPSNGVSDPTLQAVLADERSLQGWPKTIHALIVDLPNAQRCALLGNALGYSQATIGQHIGVSQPRVCIVLRLARRTLGIQLAVMRHVRRAQGAVEHELAQREGR